MLRSLGSLVAVLLLGLGGDSAAVEALPDIEYRIILESAEPVRLLIEMTTTGFEGGTTNLEVTDGWGGVEAAGEDFESVQVTAQDGTALSVERTDPFRWVVRHTPRAPIRVRWAIAANANQAGRENRVHYRPIVNESLVHLIGELALLRPTHLDDERSIRVSIEWAGFGRHGWKVASSFGVGPKRHEVEGPFRRVREAVYIAGPIAILERRVHDRSVVIALAGDEWSFGGDELADLVQKVVALEREFFDDLDRSYYLVTMIPVGERLERGFHLGGTGLTNSFATFVMPGFELYDESGSPEIELIKLLVHEMFHEWNGHVLGLEQPEEQAYWFSEGFTNYFTRRLTAIGGWWDAHGYVEGLNDVYREYWTNPARNATAADVAERFWESRNAQRQPYLRGDLVAFLVDHAIRKRSEDAQSLDDFMRALVREARSTATGRMLHSTETLLDRIADWAGEDVARQVREVVVDGALIAVPDDLGRPAFGWSWSETVPFDLGFDLEGSIESSTITGVREGSSGWEGGLRNGQKLGSYSVRHDRSDLEARFEVKDRERSWEVRYLPEGDPVLVPAFELASESAWRERIRIWSRE